MGCHLDRSGLRAPSALAVQATFDPALGRGASTFTILIEVEDLDGSLIDIIESNSSPPRLLEDGRARYEFMTDLVYPGGRHVLGDVRVTYQVYPSEPGIGTSRILGPTSCIVSMFSMPESRIAFDSPVGSAAVEVSGCRGG